MLYDGIRQPFESFRHSRDPIVRDTLGKCNCLRAPVFGLGDFAQVAPGNLTRVEAASHMLFTKPKSPKTCNIAKEDRRSWIARFHDRLASGEISMHRFLKQIVLTILPVAFSGGFAVAQKQARRPVTTVLLVHGAFADSSSWKKIIPILKAKGLQVVTVDIPLTSLAEDVAVTKHAIAQQSGPLLLVGHSYGGTVISEAGDDPKIAGLVYVAAYAPGVGQTTGELGVAFPATPGRAEIQPLPGGLLHLTQKGVSEDFAPDLTASEQTSVFTSQLPLD